MKRCCRFIKDLLCDGEIIFKKDKEYEINFENENSYWFREVNDGIDKQYNYIYFVVIERKD